MKINKTIVYFLLFLSVLGFINSVVVYLKMNVGEPIACFIIQGCDKVLSSSYSKLFGISLGMYGIIGYLFLFILILLFIKYKKRLFFILYKLGIFLGFGFSLYLFYIQAFVLNQFCSYCLVSFIDMGIMAIVQSLKLKLES